MAQLTAAASPRVRLCDIGVNLLDPMFRGVYRGKERHAPDLEHVLRRATAHGVERMLVTAGSLAEAREAVAEVRRRGRAYGDGGVMLATVGVHPTRCGEFDAAEGGPEAHQRELLAVLEDARADGVAAAVGECGLDYARLEFCPREQQLAHFERHFELAERARLPMFLHLRDADDDMLAALERNRARFAARGGVVHSFDGSLETMRRIVGLGLHVGINGCSLRTEESLRVAAEVPADRLLLETDAPWCGVRRTHPGYAHVRTHFEQSSKPERHEPAPDRCVKGRCEPAHLVQVLEVVAAVRGVEPAALAAAVWENSERLFFSQ